MPWKILLISVPKSPLWPPLNLLHGLIPSAAVSTPGTLRWQKIPAGDTKALAGHCFHSQTWAALPNPRQLCPRSLWSCSPLRSLQKVLGTKWGAEGTRDCPHGQWGQGRALRLGRVEPPRAGTSPGKGAQPGVRCEPPGVLLLLVGDKRPIENSQFPVIHALSTAETASPQTGASSSWGTLRAGLALELSPPCQAAPLPVGNGDIQFLLIHGEQERLGQGGVRAGRYLEEKQTLVAMKSKTSLIFFLLGNLETSLL